MRIFDRIRGISKEERENLKLIKKSAYYGTRNKIDEARRIKREQKKLDAQKQRATKAAEQGKALAEFGRKTPSKSKPKKSPASYPQKVSKTTSAKNPYYEPTNHSTKKEKAKTVGKKIISGLDSWSKRKAEEQRQSGQLGVFKPGANVGIDSIFAPPATKKKKTTRRRRK